MRRRTRSGRALRSWLAGIALAWLAPPALAAGPAPAPSPATAPASAPATAPAVDAGEVDYTYKYKGVVYVRANGLSVRFDSSGGPQAGSEYLLALPRDAREKVTRDLDRCLGRLYYDAELEKQLRNLPDWAAGQVDCLIAIGPSRHTPPGMEAAIESLYADYAGAYARDPQAVATADAKRELLAAVGEAGAASRAALDARAMAVGRVLSAQQAAQFIRANDAYKYPVGEKSLARRPAVATAVATTLPGGVRLEAGRYAPVLPPGAGGLMVPIHQVGKSVVLVNAGSVHMMFKHDANGQLVNLGFGWRTEPGTPADEQRALMKGAFYVVAESPKVAVYRRAAKLYPAQVDQLIANFKYDPAPPADDAHKAQALYLDYEQAYAADPEGEATADALDRLISHLRAMAAERERYTAQQTKGVAAILTARQMTDLAQAINWDNRPPPRSFLEADPEKPRQ